jgi:lipopolysaccharide transport system ATP-binding protein
VSIIAFENVSKRYRLGRSSLRETVAALLGGQDQTDHVEALKDVSFALEEGGSLGIIGPNGAGKTTILKLMAGITAPTRGTVSVNGRVSALIELGAGFHPDLSGRENVYLYGAILGLKRHEIAARFDDIVEFAEIGRFIDTPLKRYSWGMQARLAFAVAAHVEPDILLVDEVLSVGDAAYQVRCADRIGQMRDGGTTIVFVSHYLDLIVETCPQTIFLDGGEIQYMGETQEAVNRYQEALRRVGRAQAGATPGGLGVRSGSFEMAILEVRLLDGEGRERQTYQLGEKMVVRIAYVAHRPVREPVFGVEITRQDGLYCYATNTRWDGLRTGWIDGRGVIEMEIPHLNLSAGAYLMGVGILERNAIAFYDFHDKAYPFQVQTSKKDRGVLYLDHTWRFIDS